MSWLEFVADLVESLAWPGAVLGIVLILRVQLKGLIPLLQRLKYKDLELEFGRRLEAAKSEADVAEHLPEPQHQLPPSSRSPFIERVATLAATSPRAAVLEAWREVESEASSAARRSQLIGDKMYERTPANLVRTLRRSENFDPAVLSLLEDLRVLRNQAAHAPDFALGLDNVMEYAFLAEQLITYFKSR